MRLILKVSGDAVQLPLQSSMIPQALKTVWSFEFERLAIAARTELQCIALLTDKMCSSVSLS